MLVHPDISPVAFGFPEFSLFGLHVHLHVRWYGLMYLLGFWGAWWLAVRRGRFPHVGWSKERVSDALFYGVLGVVLGGRIGYLLFYAFDEQGHWQPASHPLMVFRIWEGGMSFHGGLLGVIIAMIVFAWQKGLKFWDVIDFAAVVTPFGLFTGRIGNFINGELWGAHTTLPWGMTFPTSDPACYASNPTALQDCLPRHPSMLYEAALEGLVMLAVLWWFGRKPRPRMAISGLFLLLYGSFRFAVEFVRVPDRQLGYLYGTSWFTMGMQLCVPMLAFGLLLMALAYTWKQYAPAAPASTAA